MSRERTLTVIAAVLLLSAFSSAQSRSGQAPASAAEKDKTPPQKPNSPGNDRVVTIVLPSGVVPVAVPDGEGAWVVHINTGGGFGGTRSDSVTVTSVGNFACNGAKTSGGDLLPPNLEILSQLVAAVRPVAVPFDQSAQGPASICSDCYQTSLTLSRREAKGKVKTYVTTWDTVTRARLAKDLQQLYESVIQLVACQQ